MTETNAPPATLAEYPNGARAFRTMRGYSARCPLHGGGLGIYIGESNANEAAARHAECFVPPPPPPAKSRRRYCEAVS